jgi:ADP-heptose:LPS heptosyltransferase
VTTPASDERILLVRTSHLGDCVRALPLARALLEQRPRARVAWAIQPEYAPLAEGLAARGRAIEVLRVPRHEGLRGTWRGLRRVRAFGADLAIDAQGNAKSALVVAASRARSRLGLAARHRREAFAGKWVLRRQAESPPDAGPHAQDRTAELARALDLDLDAVAEGPEMSAGELDRARAFLDAHFGDRPPRLAYVAASGDARSWPAERWRELLDAGRARGVHGLLLGGPQETRLLAELAAIRPSNAPLSVLEPPLDLRAWAAVCAVGAERGGRLLSTDTGPTHLAASVGLPAILISGPTDPRRTGPWPDPARDSSSPHRILGYDPPWEPGRTHLRRAWEWPGPPAAAVDAGTALATWFAP